MKNLSLLLISLIVLTGCGTSDNLQSGEENEQSANAGKSEESVETTDWEPTIFETVNNFDGVKMEIKEGSLSPAGLTVVIKNDTPDKQLIFGEDFLLEKKIDGSWYQVPVTFEGNYGFDSIGYEVKPSNEGEWTVDWEWLYGSLEAGEYRIVKEVLDFRGTGEFDMYHLAAEFSLTE